jgi:hypothetical protein
MNGYTLVALQVALNPSGDVVIPDASLAFGATLLIAFLFICWIAGGRDRSERPQSHTSIRKETK